MWIILFYSFRLRQEKWKTKKEEHSVLIERYNDNTVISINKSMNLLMQKELDLAYKVNYSTDNIDEK